MGVERAGQGKDEEQSCVAREGRKEGSGDGGKEERVVRPSGCHLDPTYMSPKRWSLERSGGRLETWQRRPRSSRVDKKLKLLRCHSTSPADRPRPSLPPPHKCPSPSLGGRHSCSKKKAFKYLGDSFLFFLIKISRQLCRLQTILLNRGHSGPSSRHYLLNFGSLSYRDGGPRWLAPYLAGSPLRPVA